MNERIQELIKQATVEVRGHGAFGEPERYTKLDPEKFAELVRADEREACAKVCEKMEWDYWHSAEDRNNFTPIDCAEAIRARGEIK
jgi:hypothetical protein